MYAAVAALVAAVIYGPMLLPGYPLRYDLVSVPGPVLGEDALGLGDRLPRAIPLDAAVAVLAKVLPDDLVTQLLGLLALTLAGWGVAVLTPAPVVGRLLALLVAEWNPFVLEQLAIGHLPHLLGYGALPWVAVFARALARGSIRGRRGGVAEPVRARGEAGTGPSLRKPGPRWAVSDGVRAWGGMTAAAGIGSLTPGGGALVVIAGLAGLLAGSSGGRITGTGDIGTGHVGTGDVGSGDVGSGDVGTGHVGTGNIGSGDVGTEDVGTGAIGTGDVGTGVGRERRGARVLIGVVSLGVLQLPWLVAAAAAPAFSAPSESGADGGISAFELSSETGWGRLIDAAGLAGMWNQGSLPTSRDTVLARMSTVLLLVLAVAGLPAVRRFWRAGYRAELIAASAAAGIGYLVAVLPVLPGGAAVLKAMIDALPGAGLLRDGHRWLGLTAIALAVLAGLGVNELATRRSAEGPVAQAGNGTRIAVALFAALLVVASMPDLVGGLAGRLRSRHYPAQWTQVRTVLGASDDRARVLILPWQPFRRFAWSGPDPVLDPAPRLLPRQSIVSDALSVSGHQLPEEGLGARTIAADLVDGTLSADRLRSLAIGWVLIERGTPGRLPVLPPGWTTVLNGPDLTLLRAPQPLPSAPRAGTARMVAVAGTQGAAGLLFLAGLSVIVWDGRRLAWTARRRRAATPDQLPLSQ